MSVPTIACPKCGGQAVLDDYFAEHEYGVQFDDDDHIYRATEIKHISGLPQEDNS